MTIILTLRGGPHTVKAHDTKTALRRLGRRMGYGPSQAARIGIEIGTRLGPDYSLHTLTLGPTIREIDRHGGARTVIGEVFREVVADAS
jgi:hypothetical protein